jgi:hypothetical protein
MFRRPMPSVARAFVGISLALVVAGAGFIATPLDASAAARQPVLGNSNMLTWLHVAAKFAPFFVPGMDLGTDQPQLTDGTDGRFTIALFGNDSRGTGIQRTDTVMIASIKGNTMTAASIPRDTARILNPFTANPNDYFKGKINTILKALRKTRTVAQALNDFEYVLEQELNIEIDAHVLVTMSGFQNMVEEIDPIKVKITTAIKDTKFWDNPNKTRGAYFPVSYPNYYDLWAWQPGVDPALCDGTWRSYASPPSNTWCRRAIVFVRSRKGAGNSDFKRAGRQQELVAGAVASVLARGSGALGALVAKANSQAGLGYLYTSANFPLTYANASYLFDQVAGAYVGPHVVFAPNTYSSHIPGTSSYQLKLTEVRAWAAQNLK